MTEGDTASSVPQHTRELFGHQPHVEATHCEICGQVCECGPACKCTPYECIEGCAWSKEDVTVARQTMKDAQRALKRNDEESI